MSTELIESKVTSVVTEMKDGEILQREEEMIHEKTENIFKERIEEEEERRQVGDDVTESFQQTRLEERLAESTTEESHKTSSSESSDHVDQVQVEDEGIDVFDEGIREHVHVEESQDEVEHVAKAAAGLG